MGTKRRLEKELMLQYMTTMTAIMENVKEKYCRYILLTCILQAKTFLCPIVGIAHVSSLGVKVNESFTKHFMLSSSPL